MTYDPLPNPVDPDQREHPRLTACGVIALAVLVAIVLAIVVSLAVLCR